MFRQPVRDKGERQRRPDETYVELPLVLTTSQWTALENEAAYRRQTIGELLQKLIATHLAKRNDSSLPGEPDGGGGGERTRSARAGNGERCSVRVVPAMLLEAGAIERIPMFLEDSPVDGEVQGPGQMKDELLAVLGHELRSPLARYSMPFTCFVCATTMLPLSANPGCGGKAITSARPFDRHGAGFFQCRSRQS